MPVKNAKSFAIFAWFEGENGGLVVVLDADLFDARGVDIPGLLPRHRVPQHLAGRVRNAEPQKILCVIFDRVPARCPRRQRKSTDAAG